MLRWAGVDWDETYDVRERGDLYESFVHALIENKDAYYCFCSRDRLKEMKKYDGHCRKSGMSSAEVQQRLHDKEPHQVRLVMPRKGRTEWKDIVQGPMVVNHAEGEGEDMVLKGFNGNYSQTLMGVVDDFKLKISHVIRGVVRSFLKM